MPTRGHRLQRCSRGAHHFYKRATSQGFAVAVKMGVSKKMMDTVVGVHPSSAGSLQPALHPWHDTRTAVLSRDASACSDAVPCVALSLLHSPLVLVGALGLAVHKSFVTSGSGSLADKAE